MAERFGLKPSATWHRGERDRSSRVRDSSGMNVPVADAASGAEAIDAAVSWVAAHHSLLLEVSAQRCEIELDFGMFVGSQNSFAPSLFFPAGALLQFAEAGVSVTVSAYPTSCE